MTNFMRLIYLLALLTFALPLTAQQPNEALATATGRVFTAADLTPHARQHWDSRKEAVAATRSALRTRMLNEHLLAVEAKSAGTTPEELIAAQYKKAPNPSEDQIKAVFDANRNVFGDRSIDDARQQIVGFLRRDPEQKALQAYLESLSTKYKVSPGKDINAAGLKPTDVIFSAAGKSFTVQEFETQHRIELNDAEADIIDEVKADLESTIFSILVLDEAKAQNIDPGSLIAREISDKLKDFSDEERSELESALRRKLFAKYNVRFTIPEPRPIVQNISVDDDPMIGKPSAPVTVVMFSDFQCPACARTHPILKKVLSEYGDKVRFVVRDFPLENIHESAFGAALAASAAHKQGKFVEYIEILYTNQNALDASSLKKYAADIGLNVKQFEIDLASEKSAAEVRKDIEDGMSYGVAGTPTIFVNGVKVRRLSADSFRDAIDAALKR